MENPCALAAKQERRGIRKDYPVTNLRHNRPFCQSSPHRPPGALLIAITPGHPLTVQQIGVCECEGLASAALAERLRPQLDGLADAVKRVGGAA